MHNKVKAAVFDFDGTLTKGNIDFWRELWYGLGYELGEGGRFDALSRDYASGKISYEEWCVLTGEAFRESGLTYQRMRGLIDKMTLMDGTESLVQILKDNGLSLHIVSGNLVSAIELRLGKLKKYFDNIAGNEMVFDDDGKFERIIPTKYDQEGKAEYIKQLAKRMNISTKQIVFVGNGDNDQWAYKSGCKTICVNPINADEDNPIKWSKVYRNLDNIIKILPEIIN